MEALITLSPAAAARIRQSAAESGITPVTLRVAAKLSADGTVEYGMGFDELRPGDATLEADGVVVVVAEASRELIEGTRLDFVEFQPGDFRFIFAPPGDTAVE